VTTQHLVLRKPDIVIHWGEDIVYPSDSTEDEIRVDLQRRVDKENADEEKEFNELTQEQKNYCASHKTTPFVRLPKYCWIAVSHGDNALPKGWQDQLRNRPRTIMEALDELAPLMIGPPALLLLVGWVGVWIARGFRAE